jgi:Tol biopolymer transport system component
MLAVVLMTGCADISGIITPMVDPQPEGTPQTTSAARVAAPSPTPTAEEEANIRPIVFASTRATGDTFDIFLINSDGSGLARLTDDPAADEIQPVWSPDLSQIAFVSDATGRNQVYVFSLNNYEIAQLTDHPEGAIWPTWAPGGDELAYIVDNEARDQIVVIDVSSGEQSLEQTLAIGDLGHLDWSPDGNRFVFAARPTVQSPDMDIFSIDVAGARLINLTNRPANDRFPSWSPDGSRVLFQSDQNGNEDIFVMQANGSLQTPLTSNMADDGEPAWSSGGNRIVFVSDRDGNPNLYTMSDSGADVSALAVVEGRDAQPDWQPDPVQAQEEIAYAGGVLNSLNNVLVVNANGSGLAALTNNTTSDDTMPTWSPDGERLAFASTRGGNYDIYVLDRSASDIDPVQLTDSPGRDFHPAWSPDGSRIAFESNRDGNWDIWVMDADGSNQRQLTLELSDDGNPAWSPDGSRILFSSNRDGDYDIWVKSVDGEGDVENLTRNEVDDFFPAWSPDGTLIAYRSWVDGRRELHLMNSRGQAQRRLFFDDADNDQPTWSPDSLRLAFVSNRRFEGEGDGITYQLYVYELATRNIRRISPLGVNVAYPDWKPRGGR